MIIKPGLYSMDADTYHSDPVEGGSVSSTTLKILFEQSPAHARHYLDHGRPPERHFDIGTAVHALTLGVGRELTVWHDESRQNWQSNDAKAFMKAAYAAGRIPLLLEENTQVLAMVAAIRAHRLLGRLLEPGRFTPEQACVWRDPDTGLWCRAMFDAVPDFHDTMTIIDLKTCQRADPDSIAKAIVNYRYDMQGEHYTDGARVLGLAAQVRFLLAFVEKKPPHVITVRPIGPDTVAFARIHRRKALDIYAQCVRTGHWPGFDDYGPDDELEPIEAPYWARRAWDNAHNRGDYEYEPAEGLF